MKKKQVYYSLIESTDALDRVCYNVNKDVKARTLGVGISIILHKALGNQTSNLEYPVLPPVLISKVKDGMNKIVLLAKQCEIKLLVYTERKHYRCKEKVDN